MLLHIYLVTEHGMDKDYLELILETLKETGVSPIYLFFGVLLLGIWLITIWTLRDAFKEKIKNFKLFKSPIEIRFKHKYKIKDLKNHELFAHLESLKYNSYVFYTHDEPDMSKTRAFQDFLNAKMSSTIEHTKKILDESTESMDPVELRHLIETNFNKCNCNVEKLMMEKFEKKGLSLEHRRMLIDKFLSVRQVAMDNYSKTFTSIFNSRTFNSNYEILNTILFVIHNEGIQMVSACIEAFEEINGAFIGVDY